MSEFGRRLLTEAGYDPLYVPHSLDMAVWSPLEDRQAAREQLSFADRFVIGINAANQDPFRKGFGEQIAAFREFARRHDDALMLIHTRAETRQGADLQALVDYYGVAKQVIFGDQYMIAAGLVSEAQMASWHGVLDVLSNTAYGEGFGLAVLQSQACGVPVIVNGFSAMDELCGAGWKVDGQDFWNRGHNAPWRVPFIGVGHRRVRGRVPARLRTTGKGPRVRDGLRRGPGSAGLLGAGAEGTSPAAGHDGAARGSCVRCVTCWSSSRRGAGPSGLR